MNLFSGVRLFFTGQKRGPSQILSVFGEHQVFLRSAVAPRRARVRIPRDVDQRSELMPITIPT